MPALGDRPSSGSGSCSRRRRDDVDDRPADAVRPVVCLFTSDRASINNGSRSGASVQKQIAVISPSDRVRPPSLFRFLSESLHRAEILDIYLLYQARTSHERYHVLYGYVGVLRQGHVHVPLGGGCCLRVDRGRIPAPQKSGILSSLYYLLTYLLSHSRGTPSYVNYPSLHLARTP